MKNKILKILTVILSVSLLAFLLTACEHKHSFGEDNYCKCGEPNWELVYTYENGTITGLTNFGKTLTELEIPETINGVAVTRIGSYAFEDCTSLKSIEIPYSVTSISNSAFYGCSLLTSVVIPNSVTSIGKYAFYECTKLTNIVIPDSVISIGEYAFSGCTKLASINVVDGNKKYKSIDDNLYSKDGKTLIQYAIGKTQTAFTIPNSVTSIGLRAFYYCTSLTSVEIPNSVTRIGDYAFSGCSSLTSVVIPSSVTSIETYAFSRCSSLTIYCEEESKPSGWDEDWNITNCPVEWGYTA